MSIISFVDRFDTQVKIAAHRAIAHRAMAKAIGSIRQDMRLRARADVDPTLDERNEHDESVRSEDYIKAQMGFERTEPPIEQASHWVSVYSYSNDVVRTLASSKWEYPMDLDTMLDYMESRSDPLPEALVQALANATGAPETDIKRLHELQDLKDRERLAEDRSEIVSTFHGLSGNGYETAAYYLNPIEQHQLAVKVYQGLKKGKDRILTTVMRTRRMDSLGDLPLFDKAIEEVANYIAEFEDQHKMEIDQAIEAGRSLQTI